MPDYMARAAELAVHSRAAIVAHRFAYHHMSPKRPRIVPRSCFACVIGYWQAAREGTTGRATAVERVTMRSILAHQGALPLPRIYANTMAYRPGE